MFVGSCLSGCLFCGCQLSYKLSFVCNKIINKRLSTMEKHLERVLEEIVSEPKVEGCLFADNQGLCLGSAGNANVKHAGLYVALAQHAAKIEPQNPNPVITFDNGKKSLIIQRNGTLTCAISKTSQA